MKSRRIFIAETGIATAAMFILRPFSSIASSSVARKLGLINNTKLVLLHTGNNDNHIQYAERKVTSLKKDNHPILLLKHDSSSFSTDNYEVVYTDNIKVGIIKVNSNDKADDVNSLASYLKKEKGCRLVVCCSALGYKNKNGFDDSKLAEESADIDVIIGNNVTNHTPFPVVARNSKRGEVIIHYAVDNGFGLGNIEIEFDEKTFAKKNVAINNLLSRLPKTA